METKPLLPGVQSNGLLLGLSTSVKLKAPFREYTSAIPSALFSRLKKSGLVDSIKGPGGGYNLSKDANEIVISEVIQAVDEDLETTACNGKSNCHNNHQCISHNLWQDLGTEINNFLSDITLKQVIAKNNSDVKEIKLSEY